MFPDAPNAPTPHASGRQLTINGGPPRAETLAQLEAALGQPLPDGAYWYDVACGAWGQWGGPCQGFLPPGLDLAGPLPLEASGGMTQVVINGRALHPMDVMGLNQLLAATGSQCLPGRWSLDAAGNIGPEGGMPLLNLYALVAAGGGGGGGDNFWSTKFSAGNSSGGAGYVRLPDGGFSTFGM